MLGEDSPEAQPLEEALKKTHDKCRVLPVGERLDPTLKFIQRSQARIEKMQDELGREKTLLEQALVSLERLRDEAANSVSEPPHNSRPPQAKMVVEDSEEEIRRLRAQVAELQQERVAGHETEESRAKKARTLSTSGDSKITQRVRFDAEPH